MTKKKQNYMIDSFKQIVKQIKTLKNFFFLNFSVTKNNKITLKYIF